MAWAGGFSGVGFDRAEFRKYLSSKPKPPYARIVIHNTDAPYIKPPVAPGQRVRNIAVHYKNMGWSGGPDLFVFHDDRVYLGSPFGKSIGCKGWNGNSFHIEAEGKYTKASGHDPNQGFGKQAWDAMAWVTAELLEWMGWQPDNTRIKFHKEGATSHKGCPGELITKPWFLGKVAEAMGGSPAPVVSTPVEKPVSPQIYDIREIQTELVRVGIDPGPVDGLIGPKTLAGIRKWQERLQVEATGLLGPWAYDRLKREPSAATGQPGGTEQTGNTRKPPETLKTSQKGLDLIKHFEGLRLAPYDDVGSLAIGYGHSNRSNRPPKVVPDLRITESEAEQILADDLVDYEKAVRKSITAPLYPHEFDALVSIAYNWGPGNLDRSRLKEVVNRGDYELAAATIRTILPAKTVKHYAGILRRRNKEADLFAGK